jgi:DNA-binding response OmpR family regulator
VIAIVDDDLEIADALKTWLEMFGRATTVHGSGESLLAWLKNNENKAGPVNVGRPLDAAIFDINLPGINGIQLAIKLRGKFPVLPIILVTALRHDEIQNLGDLPLGVSFMRKPFDLDTIESILFESLN